MIQDQLMTASLEFDGQTNDWFYEYSDDGGATTDHGAVLFGPEYNTKGSPTYPLVIDLLKEMEIIILLILVLLITEQQ
jgi:hypothetical protein